MSKNLSEERIRMRKLMGFTYKDNSHDVLAEQNIGKSIISEQGEKEEVEGEDCVTISHVGRFPVDGIAGSGAFTTFMNKIETTIKGNAKLADKITKGFVYVTDFSLIGGASNHYEGHSVTPEKNNDRKSDYSGQDYTEDNKSSHFKKNKELSVNRAKGLADELNGEDGLKRINVQFDEGILDNAKNNAQGYIIDTGGINDKPNKSSWTINGVTYQPGQVVEVSMTICYESGKLLEDPETGTTETIITKEQVTVLKKCFNGATIKVIYDPKDLKKRGLPDHSCNKAVYDIWANGYKIKRTPTLDYASLNNKGYLDDAEKEGRKRINTFTLEIDGVNSEFFNEDIIGKHSGRLVITAACRKTKAGKWRSKTWKLNGKKMDPSDCHYGVGKIIVDTAEGTDSKVVVTPSMWGVEKNVAEFPACENIITDLITDKPKVIEKIKTWWRKISSKSDKEETKKEVTRF
tara:strand:- start:1574 stop:2956 length:1383 start_codon:yes stop_codon:yes gene_type:complete